MSRSHRTRSLPSAVSGTFSKSSRKPSSAARNEKPRQTRLRAPAGLPPEAAVAWRRKRASYRELTRIHRVAKALEELRDYVPRSPDEDKPSKAKLLRQAAAYISLMRDMLGMDSAGEDVCLRDELASDGGNDSNNESAPASSSWGDINASTATKDVACSTGRNRPRAVSTGDLEHEEADNRSESSVSSGGLIKEPLAKRPRCLFPASPGRHLLIPVSKQMPIASSSAHTTLPMVSTALPQTSTGVAGQVIPPYCTTAQTTVATIAGPQPTFQQTQHLAAVQSLVTSPFHQPHILSAIPASHPHREPTASEYQHTTLLSPMHMNPNLRQTFPSQAGVPMNIATTSQATSHATICLPNPAGTPPQHGFGPTGQSGTPVSSLLIL